jgi:ribosomal-protein-serine acetyltransferase
MLNNNMTFELKINEKLSLKLRQSEDAEEMFLLTDKNREHLHPWLPWVDVTLVVEDTRRFIEKCKEKFEKKEAADFGICYEGKWIGSMGFHTINNVDEWAEIGYWIDKDFEGRGIMTECVEAIIKYGFEDLNLHRIQIKCDSFNIRSKALPEKLGFKLEGVLRESNKSENTFSDELVFGVLKSEWAR